MALPNARRWAGGLNMNATHMNGSATTDGGVSRLLDSLAGRHGVIEYEDSLRILSGSAGNRVLALPGGTTAQRTSDPSAGYLRWNSERSMAEFYSGSAWKDLIQTIAVVTYTALNANGGVGMISTTIARGNHSH